MVIKDVLQLPPNESKEYKHVNEILKDSIGQFTL